MSDWTSQKPQHATLQHLGARWSGRGPGEGFRCYLCGHRFKLGDYWRFVFGDGISPNFMVCLTCDGNDVRERFAAMQEELERRFWWWRGSP